LTEVSEGLEFNTYDSINTCIEEINHAITPLQTELLKSQNTFAKGTEAEKTEVQTLKIDYDSKLI